MTMKEQEIGEISGTEIVNLQDKEISFSYHQNYCVCVVDIVNSTEIIMSMSNPLKVREYILTFINSMSTIARRFGATIVKTLGDSVIFYFPKTSDSDSKSSFKGALDCFSSMLDARFDLRIQLRLKGLPSLSYRISSDYGRVEVAKTITSNGDDLFGSTMSLCAKINSMAPTNGIVIGGDLYRIACSLGLEEYGYKFYEIGSYPTGLKFPYPVYEVTKLDGM
jgi:class 3 adenylate cyclase